MSHIGLSRDEILHVQSVLERLDRAPAPAAADRRVYPRIDFAHPMWLWTPLAPGRPWVHVYSRNLSTGGLGFISRQPFAKEGWAIVSHRLNETVDQLALCRVTFCRPVDEGYFEVGLIFVVMQADPQATRQIPAPWLSQVLRSTWINRSGVCA